MIWEPLGVVWFSWLAVRMVAVTLPPSVSWRWITGLALLRGIGFTMSLFILELAFLDEDRLRVAKLEILSASVVAGVGEWMMLRQLTTQQTPGTES